MGYHMITSYTRYWSFSTEDLGRQLMEDGKRGLVLTEVKVRPQGYVVTLKEEDNEPIESHP